MCYRVLTFLLPQVVQSHFFPPEKPWSFSLSISHNTHSYARDFSRVFCSFDCSLSSMADQRDQHPNSPAGTSLNYLLLLLFSSQSTTSSKYKGLDTWSSWFRCRRINSSPEEKFSRKTQNRNSLRSKVEKSSSRYVSKPETTYRFERPIWISPTLILSFFLFVFVTMWSWISYYTRYAEDPTKREMAEKSLLGSNRGADSKSKSDEAFDSVLLAFKGETSTMLNVTLSPIVVSCHLTKFSSSLISFGS